jgi:hypothetical protein
MDGHFHRISAAALRNRGLVTISGRGPTWKAQITSAGRSYLEAVDSPSPPIPRQANVSVTQQLVDDLIAAGGSLRVPRKNWNEKDQVDYERRARLAQAYGKVPAGSRLAVNFASGDELLLELKPDVQRGENSPENGGSLAAVPVPERLGKPHAVAREFRERTSLHEISRKALPRAVRIVHAIAVESERRGYSIRCVRTQEDSYGRSDWKPSQDGQLLMTVNGHGLRIRIWEKGAGLRGPYENAVKRWKRDREQPFHLGYYPSKPKPYDGAAAGELNIASLEYSQGRQTTWGDRTRWSVEDRLPNLLHELETQAAEAEERRLEEERQQAERHRQWEAAMEQATQRLITDHRLEVLRKRVLAWQEAEQIRAYCKAVETRHGLDAIAADPEAEAWIVLAREYADRAQELPRMPVQPEITPERLKPYLGNWSPYGPSRSW